MPANHGEQSRGKAEKERIIIQNSVIRQFLCIKIEQK
jgi:hypothetical protein